MQYHPLGSLTLNVCSHADGVVHIANRELSIVRFQAHDSAVLFMQQIAARNLLITVGIDLGETLTTIKFWYLNDCERLEDPEEARSIKPFSAKIPEVPVTSLSALEDISQLCVGLGNGSVLLLEGDLLRGRYRTYLLQGSGPCVTGVHFQPSALPAPPSSAAAAAAEAATRRTTLFVTTTSSVCSYATKTKGHPQVVLDADEGCDINCSSLDASGDLVVARSRGVFFFQSDDVGPCYGFEGAKKRICCFGNYIVLVCEDPKDSKRDTVTIYDLQNKFVAFVGSFDVVLDVLVEFGSLFLLTRTRKLFELAERDLHTKMQMLFKRNLYTIAISVAQSQGLDDAYVMEVRQKYADHLYAKGDFCGAMSEYLNTVVVGRAYTEPSYVIRKYLEAACTDELSRYLESLHEHKCASKLHTSLLLNCFTKAKQTSKLEQFLRTYTCSDGSWSKFDVDTAIVVCRQASYFDFSLTLAKNYRKHDWAIKIMLHDMENFEGALQYIETLPLLEAEHFIKEFGENLIAQMPKETVEFLKRICTSYTPGASSITGLEARPQPEEFVHLFVDKPRLLQEFLEYVVEHEPQSSSITYTTLLELYLRNNKTDPTSNLKERKMELVTGGYDEKIMHLLRTQQAKYDPDHALVLAKRYKFEQGITFLYDKLRLYSEILEQYKDVDDYNKMIVACQKYGDTDPNLWLRALAFFASKGAQCSHHIKQVLHNIGRSNLLPPLMVVQILSRSEQVPLSIVKEYLIRSLQHEQSILDADYIEIERYKAQTAQTRMKIERLKNSSVTFQSSKCSVCTSALEVPAIHFLCMHSFHERCLHDGPRHCPKCAPEFNRLVDMHQAMKASASDHETFFKQLHDSSDGFGTVAEYFGRGIVDGADAAQTRSPFRARLSDSTTELSPRSQSRSRTASASFNTDPAPTSIRIPPSAHS